jgi:dethiobiotin synthetase
MTSKTKTFFITGTGTDVGKTIIVAGMASICINYGLRTAVMKPIQTGAAEDPGDLRKINNLVSGLEQLSEKLLSPYVFQLPSSPHLAAKTEKTTIEPELIKKSITEIYSQRPDVLLIEGAGGVLVPITENYTTLDLLRELQIPVIITALAGLGTINHTLMTVNSLKQAEVPIAGIIINKMPINPGIVEKDNVRIIEKFAKTPILGIIYDMGNMTNDFHIALNKEFNKQDKLKKILLKK